MFVDAVMANVLVFAVGQLFAWLYLRSGRFWLGAGATVTLWVAIDWWLVGRFVLATPANGQLVPLLVLQATAVSTTVAYVWAMIRRRRSAPSRTLRFREGVTQLLSGQFANADTTFRKLVWSNPWDASAWLARGDACRRLGMSARARRCYRRASEVDVRRQFGDLIEHRLVLLALPGSGSASPAGKGIAPSDGPLTKPTASKSASRARPSAIRKAASGS